MYLSELIRLEPSLLQQFTAHEVTILCKTYSYLPDIEETYLLHGYERCFLSQQNSTEKGTGMRKTDF
jgi:hypothetical protein